MSPESGAAETRDERVDESDDDEVHREITPAVLEALRKLENPRANWQQGLLIVAVTGALFVWAQGAGRSTTWQEIALLVLVLLLHELGHLAAMRVFGYRDLRIFFLPFFGAAASGKKLHATAAQQALVSLAGPLPSLVLAIALFVGSAVQGVSLDLSSAEPLPRFVMLLFVINLLNLLPIEPLDGGAFVRVVLMERVPLLQVGFRAVAAIALGVLAFAFQDWVWALLAVFLLVSCPHQYALALSARKLRDELEAERAAPSEAIPDEHLDMVARRVRLDLKQTEAAAIAASMRALWQQAHQRSARWGAAVGLLALYAVFVVPPAALLAFAWLNPEPAAAHDLFTDDDGSDVHVVVAPPGVEVPDLDVLSVQPLVSNEPLPADLLVNRLRLPETWRPTFVMRVPGEEPGVQYADPEGATVTVDVMRSDRLDAAPVDLTAIAAGKLGEPSAYRSPRTFDAGLPDAVSLHAGPSKTVTVLRAAELVFVLELELRDRVDLRQAEARTRGLVGSVEVR